MLGQLFLLLTLLLSIYLKPLYAVTVNVRSASVSCRRWFLYIYEGFDHEERIARACPLQNIRALERGPS